MPGAAPAMLRARRVARRAGRGLIQVFTASDPALTRTRRPPGRRRAIHAGLVLATVLCAMVSLFGLTNMSGLIHGAWFAKVATTDGRRITAVQQTSFVVDRFPTLLRPGLMAFGGPAVWSVMVVILALAVVAPLPLAVRYPLLGWRIAWACLLLAPLIGVQWTVAGPWDPVQLPLLLVVFCVAGVRHPRPVLWWMWALSLLPWWLYAGHGLRGLTISALGTLAFTAMAVAVDAVGTRRREVAAQTERAEFEQGRRAVLTERARIARELHDVVAHHLSLMAVRAETAPYRLADLPGPVRDEFGALSGAARAALADMRRLLGVLRDEGPAERAPQPQLADLPVLIEAARQAGMPVELSVPPGAALMTAGPMMADTVPSAVGVCAYRIVQESLSNASRHAQGAPVTVSLDHRADGVLLRVMNGPGPARAAAGAGAGAGEESRAGHGLTGMRERVALLGGSLFAGPSPDGGFVVSAKLPLAAR
jgi:signal transduction histidine kinase